MKNKGDHPNEIDDLRKQAEEKLKKRIPGLKTQTQDDAARLIHELEVHQIELEMQNEELRRAQIELEESRHRYSDLYDFAPIGYFVFGKNGMIMDVNLTGATLLGVERSLLTKIPFSNFVSKDDKDLFYSHHRKAIGSRSACSCELRLVRKDGTEFSAQLQSQALAREDSLFCRTAIMDITERKQVEEQLQKANEHISNILESITDAFVSVDHNWCYTYVNHSAAKLLGKTREQMLGNVLWDVFPEVKDSQFDKEFHRAAAQSTPVHFEAFYSPHNAWYECHCYSSDDGLSVFFTNVNERKETEQKIAKLNQELEQRVVERTAELEEVNKKLLEQIDHRRYLENEILLVSERAQRLVGQELHDDIGQLFAGTALMLKVLQQRLSDVLPEEVSYLDRIILLVEQSIDHTKRISKGLSPMNLEAGSLVTSLQELAAGTEDFGVHCTVRGNKDLTVKDTGIALNVYRIAQEALNNAVKHGNAKNIQIELTCGSDNSKLTVESDGQDFPETLPNIEGMGLKIMKYRSELIKGSLDVHRGTDGGTIVICVFPNQG